MHELLAEFVDQLRAAGIPVATSETIDACTATASVDILERAELHAALSSTLVKNHNHQPTFDIVFDTYFATSRAPDLADGRPIGAGGGPLSTQSDEELIELLMHALRGGHDALIRTLAAEAVTRYAGIEPARPAGVLLYSHRALRGVDLDGVLARLQAESGYPATMPKDLPELAAQLRSLDLTSRGNRFRDEVAAEIRRRLVADRGAAAVARTLRLPVPEDIEFMHANSEQLKRMQNAITPLARKLAANVALRRSGRRAGAPNLPATVRRSLSTGGVPVDIVTRRPRPHKPQLVVLADISGSVAAFAAFTLQFVSAINARAARVRSFMFIDGVDEVTDHVKQSRSVGEALALIRDNATLIAGDGHTDYGQVFESFAGQWGAQLTRRTSVLVLGDARSNYRPPRSDVLEAIRRRVARVLWLNPEPRQYWDTGDSIISTYARHCSGVYECRTIRQLEQVATLVE